jgi:hypothetical protein
VDKKLGREKAWGQYHCDGAVIELDPRLGSRKRLHTLIHELLHHAESVLGELDHGDLDEAARVAAAVLWRDGWRRTQK